MILCKNQKQKYVCEVVSVEANRNIQIVVNDDLLRKIVYCIEKAIGDDLKQYLRENHQETNNAIILL